MIAEPELIIGFEDGRISGASVCSRCGEFMPDIGIEELTSPEIITRFVVDFRKHMRQKHSYTRPNRSGCFATLPR